MHPSIRRAYEAGTHPLAKHPIHGVYGKELANNQFEYIKGQYSQSTGSEQFNPAEMANLLQAIMQREARHEEQLEKLGVQIVSKVWKIDPNKFKQSELGEGGGEMSPEEDSDEELTPAEQKEVHKRITLNSLTHGAAIHQMTSLHHLVKEAIDNIDPQLMPAYDKLSRGAVYSSWFVNIEQILAMMGQKGGEVSIEWEEDGPKIKAQGLIFPMLVHELAKGCMELLTAHGLPQDENTLKKVYQHADKPQAEVFHFFVGPALWRKFIKIADRERLPEIIAALSRQEPDHLHKIISAIVDNPAEAEDMINELVSEPDDFEPDEFTPEEEVQKIADMISEDPDEVIDAEELAEPKTKPRPKTDPQTPTRPEKPDPYRPPKPNVDPKPKAREY